MVNGEKVTGSIREGVSAAGERVHDVIDEVADRIEDVIDRAEVKGRRIQRQVKAELGRRWKVVDRAGRENAFVLALGALAVGVVVGYLVGRDDR